jgi:hypothetical protein
MIQWEVVNQYFMRSRKKHITEFFLTESKSDESIFWEENLEFENLHWFCKLLPIYRLARFDISHEKSR